VQGGAAAWEATCLLHWARAMFCVPLAVAGMSYGGAVVALVSCMFPHDLAVISFMGCVTPGPPFEYSTPPQNLRPGRIATRLHVA
jgi:hypothetical protein